MSISDAVPLAVMIAGALTGAAIDLRTGRVPNPLTASLACAGLVRAASGLGRLNVGAAVAGLAVGALLMLPGYLAGATGGGDVKLVAAAGTMLGPTATLWAVLFTLLAGAVIATGVAVWRGRLRLTLYGLASLLQTAGLDASGIDATDAGSRFAYAPAIAIGTIAAAVLA
ncbi:MAG: prepilin peptidase [Acidobacteria bacterium]|nr:prepilin peptidase [Acidobacteriota bacterium]